MKHALLNVRKFNLQTTKYENVYTAVNTLYFDGEYARKIIGVLEKINYLSIAPWQLESKIFVIVLSLGAWQKDNSSN